MLGVRSISSRQLRLRQPWVCSFCQARQPSTTFRASQTTPNSRSLATATKKRRNKNLLPDGPARTRFAPSPTGYLHLGSLRTALFNYLLAKRTGGQFLLRIEDTDQKRTIPDAEKRLYEDLQWAGIEWDEGPVVGGPYGPYRQSERTELYRNETNTLLASGHAYRCFCTPDRLDTLAKHRNELGLPSGYDRKCSHISAEESEERALKGEAHIVRLRSPDLYPMFDDFVYGKTGQQKKDMKKAFLSEEDRVYDDPVLIKSDGHPTYHLANVVDDHHMKITHVIRGSEWMSSTPMHMALYEAFKWEAPEFGHVPLLTEKSGQKLSKRNADIDISHFRYDLGIFPEVLDNFAALLGWSHQLKSDVFNMKELKEVFNLKFTKGNTIVAFEKLWYLQTAHAKKYATEGGPGFDQMVARVSDLVATAYPDEELAPILAGRSLAQYIAPLLRADAKSYTNASEFLSRNFPFFIWKLMRDSFEYKDPTSVVDVPLKTLHTAAAALTLTPASHWTIENHKANIAMTLAPGSVSDAAAPSEKEKAFRKELYHYLRWALSAGQPGPGIPETLEILGRDESVRRIKEAREMSLKSSNEVQKVAGGGCGSACGCGPNIEI